MGDALVQNAICIPYVLICDVNSDVSFPSDIVNVPGWVFETFFFEFQGI